MQMYSIKQLVRWDHAKIIRWLRTQSVQNAWPCGPETKARRAGLTSSTSTNNLRLCALSTNHRWLTLHKPDHSQSQETISSNSSCLTLHQDCQVQEPLINSLLAPLARIRDIALTMADEAEWIELVCRALSRRRTLSICRTCRCKRCGRRLRRRVRAQVVKTPNSSTTHSWIRSIIDSACCICKICSRWTWRTKKVASKSNACQTLIRTPSPPLTPSIKCSHKPTLTRRKKVVWTTLYATFCRMKMDDSTSWKSVNSRLMASQSCQPIGKFLPSSLKGSRVKPSRRSPSRSVVLA